MLFVQTDNISHIFSYIYDFILVNLNFVHSSSHAALVHQHLYQNVTSHFYMFLCDMQGFTAPREVALTWGAVQREPTVQIQATGLSLSAGSVTVAITVIPEMVQLSLDHVRQGITVHMETLLHGLHYRMQVNTYMQYFIYFLNMHQGL